MRQAGRRFTDDAGTDFNPRTREGCDRKAVSAGVLINPYFNPRTREGCDFPALSVAGTHRHFNPRTREGCDLQPYGEDTGDGAISIHAPVKGATLHILPFISRL